MYESSVPYGSQHPHMEDSHGFTLHWMQQLTLQSKELNNEHEAVLHSLNQLLNALDSGDPTHVAMACNVLSAEARAHFAKEVEMMRSSNYPDITEHMEQHDELMRGLARIRYKVVSGIGYWSPSSEVSMLERWFIPHLTYADRRLADFVTARRAIQKMEPDRGVGTNEPTEPLQADPVSVY
ncbi:MAG: hemerythrin family protein [Burkholderiales bacterium]|nr:hemerythrin family protein [Burkholderiales bacterium]